MIKYLCWLQWPNFALMTALLLGYAVDSQGLMDLAAGLYWFLIVALLLAAVYGPSEITRTKNLGDLWRYYDRRFILLLLVINVATSVTLAVLNYPFVAVARFIVQVCYVFYAQALVDQYRRYCRGA